MATETSQKDARKSIWQATSRSLFIRLGRDGHLLVERKSSGTVMPGVDAGHERYERRCLLIISIGTASLVQGSRHPH